MLVPECCWACMKTEELRATTSQQIEIIEKCAGITAQLNNGFFKICIKCSLFIERMSEFRQKAIDTQRRLEKINQRQITKKIYFDNNEQLRSLTKINNVKEDESYEDIETSDIKKENDTDYDFYIVRFADDDVQVINSTIDNLIDSIINDETSPNGYEQEEKNEQKKKLTRLDLIEGKPDKTGPNKCKLCKKICPNIKAFYKHLNCKHFGNKKYVLCEFCAMRFSDVQKLLRHCRSRHGMARDDSYTCAHCGYRAIDKEQLQTHERRAHTRERPFVCDHCGAGFFTKRVLVQHSRQHTQEKLYQCDKCPSKFKTKQRLCGHNIKIHLRRFVFACPLCEKKLTKLPYMRRHLHREHGLPVDAQPTPVRLYVNE